MAFSFPTITGIYQCGRIFLVALGIVDPKSPAENFIAIEIPHGVHSRLLVGVFAEAKALGLTSFPVVNNPLKRDSVSHHTLTPV